MLCTVCGNERPERGTCRECGSKLCCNSECRAPLPVGRKSLYCKGCAEGQNKRSKLRDPDYNKRYYEKNRAKLLEDAKNRYAANPAPTIENARKWHAENKEKAAERKRQWRLDNPEETKRRAKVRYQENIDAIKEDAARWYAENRDRAAENHRRWREANREKDRERWHRRRARKKGCVVGDADVAAVLEASKGICSLCSSFVPDGDRQVDHIVPLDKGGPHSRENLQMVCYRCNSVKGSKLPEDVSAPRWTKNRPTDQPYLLNPDWK